VQVPDRTGAPLRRRTIILYNLLTLLAILFPVVTVGILLTNSGNQRRAARRVRLSRDCRPPGRVVRESGLE